MELLAGNGVRLLLSDSGKTFFIAYIHKAAFTDRQFYVTSPVYDILYGLCDG